VTDLKIGVLWLLLATAGISGAPMRNSPHKAIQTADLVLVGDIVSGSALNGEGIVDCLATVHPLRILKSQPGFTSEEIQVHWRYQWDLAQASHEPTTIGPINAIWFLTKREDAAYDALFVDIELVVMGGYLVPVPAGEPTGPYASSREASLDRKLAGELGSALEAIAIVVGNHLDTDYRSAGSRAGSYDPTTGSPYDGADFLPGSPRDERREQRREFQSLASLYKELNPESNREVNRYLISRPQIHLKAVGLSGEFRAKSVDALLTMETVYPGLAVSGELVGLSFEAANLDIVDNEAAIRAVGRMCVSSTGCGVFAAGQLARTKSRAAVPYLAAMLENPDETVRSSAAEGICATVAADADLRGLADSTLLRACGFTTVVINRVGAHHGPSLWPDEPDVSLLKEWTRTHPSAVRETVAPRR
jgi:hypothetical protein